MSKGIAINTILYLLLGVIVVGIVVYMVYAYSTGSSMDINKCRIIVTNWCNSCMIAGWPDVLGTNIFGKITAGSDLEKCITNYFKTSTFTPTNANCNKTSGGSGGESKTFCKQFSG